MTMVLLGDDVIPNTWDSNVELLRACTNTNVVLLGLNFTFMTSLLYAFLVAVQAVAVLSEQLDVL